MKRIYLFTFLLCLFGQGLAQTLIDGIYYNLDADNLTAKVTSMGSGTYSGSISIPESVTYEGKEYSVTSIGHAAFSHCKGLTSIIIPNSVTSIEESAFCWCIGLTSITIPNSVTSIGQFAFMHCTGLTSLTIPKSVTSIESYAFNYCTGLTSLTIPDGVTSIGDWAFYGCSGLTSLTIPSSVTSIGYYAFAWCSSLTSLTMNPATPPSLGGYVFDSCTNLSTIYVPNEDILLAYEAVAPWNNYNICIVESGADDTGIEAVEMEGETMSNVPVYDLNGRRVGTSRTLGSLSKGIYVVGGKKIIR